LRIAPPARLALRRPPFIRRKPLRVQSLLIRCAFISASVPYSAAQVAVYSILNELLADAPDSSLLAAAAEAEYPIPASFAF